MYYGLNFLYTYDHAFFPVFSILLFWVCCRLPDACIYHLYSEHIIDAQDSSDEEDSDSSDQDGGEDTPKV
jgi:hypothetical protein